MNLAVVLAAFVSQQAIGNKPESREYTNVYLPRDMGLGYTIEKTLATMSGEARDPQLYYLSRDNLEEGVYDKVSDFIGTVSSDPVFLKNIRGLDRKDQMKYFLRAIRTRLLNDKDCVQAVKRIIPELQNLGLIKKGSRVRFVDTGFKTFPLMLQAILTSDDDLQNVKDDRELMDFYQGLNGLDIQTDGLVINSSVTQFLAELNPKKWDAKAQALAELARLKRLAEPGILDYLEGTILHPISWDSSQRQLVKTGPEVQREAYATQVMFGFGAVEYQQLVNEIELGLQGQGFTLAQSQEAAPLLIDELLGISTRKSDGKAFDFIREINVRTDNLGKSFEEVMKTRKEGIEEILRSYKPGMDISEVQPILARVESIAEAKFSVEDAVEEHGAGFITSPVNQVKEFINIDEKGFKEFHTAFKEHFELDMDKILSYLMPLAFVMGEDDQQTKALKKKSVKIKGNGQFSMAVQHNIDLFVVDSRASFFMDGDSLNAPFLVIPQSNGRLKVMGTQVVMDQINHHSNWQKSFAVILDYLWKYHQTNANVAYKQKIAKQAMISHSGTIGLQLRHLEEWVEQLRNLHELGGDVIQINHDVIKTSIAYPSNKAMIAVAPGQGQANLGIGMSIADTEEEVYKLVFPYWTQRRGIPFDTQDFDEYLQKSRVRVTAVYGRENGEIQSALSGEFYGKVTQNFDFRAYGNGIKLGTDHDVSPASLRSSVGFNNQSVMYFFDYGTRVIGVLIDRAMSPKIAGDNVQLSSKNADQAQLALTRRMFTSVFPLAVVAALESGCASFPPEINITALPNKDLIDLKLQGRAAFVKEHGYWPISNRSEILKPLKKYLENKRKNGSLNEAYEMIEEFETKNNVPPITELRKFLTKSNDGKAVEVLDTLTGFYSIGPIDPSRPTSVFIHGGSNDTGPFEIWSSYMDSPSFLAKNNAVIAVYNFNVPTDELAGDFQQAFAKFNPDYIYDHSYGGTIVRRMFVLNPNAPWWKNLRGLYEFVPMILGSEIASWVSFSESKYSLSNNLSSIFAPTYYRFIRTMNIDNPIYDEFRKVKDNFNAALNPYQVFLEGDKQEDFNKLKASGVVSKEGNYVVLPEGSASHGRVTKYPPAIKFFEDARKKSGDNAQLGSDKINIEGAVKLLSGILLTQPLARHHAEDLLFLWGNKHGFQDPYNYLDSGLSKGLFSPATDIDELFAEIPSGSTFLGSGLSALVFRIPDGHALRIARGSNPRPKVDGLLQPLKTKMVGEYQVETLPLVSKISSQDLSKAIGEINERLKPQGYRLKSQEAIDINNFGIYEGKYVVIDPGAIEKDHAMRTPGGIDLTPANMNLQTQNNGGEIKFHIDRAMLEQLQNASGFVAVIINIQPVKDLPGFLGILNVNQ